MKQPCAERVPLHALVDQADADYPLRFLADNNKHYSLSCPGSTASVPHDLTQFKDRCVMLAMPRQLDTALALLALDGVAKRIILWPFDGPMNHFGEICRLAGTEIVISDCPLAVEGQDTATFSLDGTTHLDRYLETEWVLLTSGTTGRPKLVVHTLHSLAAHLLGKEHVAPGITWCTFYDTRRYGGLQILLRALVQGGSIVLSEPGEPINLFLRRAASEGATHFLGTPSHWRKVLMSDAVNAIAPQYVRLSGEIADQAILDRLKRTYDRARIVHAFASTEAGLAFEVQDGIQGIPVELLNGNNRSEGTELRLLESSLQVRSPRTAAGYLKYGIVSIADADGFVDTGDRLALRDGRLHFIGRSDGIVNVGGQKVHPERVESILNQHPSVQMSRVRARANPITGALVSAEVVCLSGSKTLDGHSSKPEPGKPPKPEIQLKSDILAHCRVHLAAHEVPATLRFVADLEISAAGKLVRQHA